MQNITINVRKKEYLDPNDNNSSYIAIKNLSLKISRGQFCSIIGPSGCGKTTLLNLISGLDKKYDGYIGLEEDKKIQNLRKAYMFQNPRLLPWLNVLENVEVVLNKKQKKTSKSKEFLSLMGLKNFFHYYPSKLSGGMQRRVALARSFATEPELLILDEPFTSLDQPVADLLRKMLLKLWTKQPTTVLFVTHDINEAIFLADKIIFLSSSPAKVIKEINIDIPRPRDFNNKNIQKVKENILIENSSILKGEL